MIGSRSRTKIDQGKVSVGSTPSPDFIGGFYNRQDIRVACLRIRKIVLLLKSSRPTNIFSLISGSGAGKRQTNSQQKQVHRLDQQFYRRGTVADEIGNGPCTNQGKEHQKQQRCNNDCDFFHGSRSSYRKNGAFLVA
jgi:hypothetical protein